MFFFFKTTLYKKFILVFHSINDGLKFVNRDICYVLFSKIILEILLFFIRWHFFNELL